MEWIILLKRINDTNSCLLKIKHLYVEESKKNSFFFLYKKPNLVEEIFFRIKVIKDYIQ
jgi:hypothetical protein